VVGPRPANIQVYAIAPTFRQTALAWYWPVAKEITIHEERRCHLLALILTERLRIRLREELGATYAPSVSFTHVDGFPGLNYFSFYAEVDPGRLEQALQILQRETTALSRKGPTADEFERARAPYVRSMKDDLRSNPYWGGTVLEDAQLRPSRIAAARDRMADLNAMTRAELTTITAWYLDPKLAFKFATLPVKSPQR
jgi:zinc protease